MIFVKTQAEQEQIDELLTRHVNRIIRSIFEKKLKGMAFDDVREVIPKDEVFCRKVRNYLPKSYPADLTGEAFLSVYYIYLMTIYITRDDVRDWMSHHPEYHKVNKMGVTEVRIFI